jgi:SAM-dependent methyltransferase
MDWSLNGEAWLEELSVDSAYENVVTPLLLEVLQPESGHRYLDLGSGEGRVIRSLNAAGVLAHGVDLNQSLAKTSTVPTIVGELPDLSFLRPNWYDGAYSVLSIEHIEDVRQLFRQVSNVVRSGGSMAVVMNHPTWTAPGSTPITDTDGEVLWRPGQYFSTGTTEEPLGSGSVTFHHRSMGELLNMASEARWNLQHVIEQPHHDYDEHGGIPRLLACRWQLLP